MQTKARSWMEAGPAWRRAARSSSSAKSARQRTSPLVGSPASSARPAPSPSRASPSSSRPNDSNVVVSLFSGSLSGIAESSVVNAPFNIAAKFPLDLVKRWIGAAHIDKSSIAGSIRQILQKEGPHGFYRSIVSEYLKVVPSVGIAFMTYEILKSEEPSLMQGCG